MKTKNFNSGNGFLRLGLWLSCCLWGFTMMHAQNNIGIGTASPAERLHVSGGNIRLSGTFFASSPSLSISSSTAVSIGGTQTHNIGINFERVSDWVGSVRHVWSSNPGATTPNVLRLSSSAANANDLVIDDQGRVGIGRRNPTSRLHVDGTLRAEGTITTGGALAVLGNATIGGALNLSGEANFSNRATITTASNGNVIFSTVGNHVVNLNNNLYVNRSTNRVGIGTASPSEKLEVIGNTRLIGNLELNGGANISTNLSLGGKITNQNTGNANNLLPVCYGSVFTNGTKLGGTSNFTSSLVRDLPSGNSWYYVITSPQVTENSIIMITLSSSSGNAASYIPTARPYNGFFRVRLHFQFAQVANNNGDFGTAPFHFVVYNP